ncbi:MAG: LamG-like jellyroll fold domain-containing protein [Gammaproteobacteria bacterium]
MKNYLILLTALCCFSSNADQLIHTYTFETGLSDEVGSIDLVATGGAVAAGRFFFSPGDGLTLNSGLTDTSQYSIEMYMQFGSLEPFYKKLVDFQNLTADAGLYIRQQATTFYPTLNLGPDSIEAGEDFQVVLTRSLDGILSVYLNGELQTEDSTTLGISVENIVHFLLDDSGGTEAGVGSVEYIRIYDGPLSAQQVADLLPPYKRGDLLHTYTFETGVEDSTGTVDLSTVGGLVQNDRFEFDLGTGLTLVDGLPDTSDYTIELKLRFDAVFPNWKKVIDFQALSNDQGVYIRGTQTEFYPESGLGPNFITEGEDFHLVVTRTEDLLRIYLNGQLQTETTTVGGISQDNIINFFLDDITTLSTEEAPGSVDYIRVFFGALTGGEISRLVPPAPAQPVVVRDLFSAGDGLITYDSSTNLEWLDITETIGLSINNILNEPNVWVPEGFTVATREQIIHFIQSLGVRDVGFTSALNATGVSSHLDLVGCTWSCTGTSFQRSTGVVMNDNLTSGSVLNLDYLFTPTPDLGSARFISSTGLDESVFSRGVYLVREAEFADSDGDSVPDTEDNCSLVANDNQRDTDEDGFGNVCDPDLNNDGIVNFVDVSLWIEFFGSTVNEDTDFNGDGLTNLLDYVVLVNYIFSPPGPGAAAF